MSEEKFCESLDEAIELPRVIRLGTNLYAVPFVLMKMVPAKFILRKAHAEGRIGKGSVIVESTSGTFGLALAIIAALRGYRLILVSDPAIDPALKRRLEALGTRVEIVERPAAVGGYQVARLNRLAEIQAEHPDHFWPSQYHNPQNGGSYSVVAALLAGSVGRVDCLVGTCGSGGSMCGTSAYLRVLFPKMHVVAVDTHGSVLFGHPDEKRPLRGLGNSLMPSNLDHTTFNEVHWVTASEAFCATRQLHSRHALYMGGTSGAAYMVAQWWAKRHPEANVAVLLPDEGHRYQDTIYNQSWLCGNDLFDDQTPEMPHLVLSPLDAQRRWSRLNWNRRSFSEVMRESASSTPGDALASLASSGK